MNLDLFRLSLDTFGSDFHRWPEKDRAVAERLRDSSDEARQLWQAAHRLDTLFALDRAIEPDMASQSAITDAALRRIRGMRQAPGFDWRWLFAKPMSAALGATLAAGVLAGVLAGPVLQTSKAQGTLAVSALLDAGGGDLEDLL